jgi:subtilase family serine protease
MHIRREKRAPWRALIVLAVVGAAIAATAAGAQHARSLARGTMTAAVQSGPKLALEGKVTSPGTQPGPLRNCQKAGTCYGPDQIRVAYGVQPLLNKGITGAGRTIVIIDAYGSDTLSTDLTTFDAYFGLPNPTLNVIYPDGPPLPTDPVNAAGWKGETSLDVQWAHAIAPGATIDLVVAKSNNDADILSATKYVSDHNLGDVVSQSFGEAEACMDPSLLAQQHKLFQKMTDQDITLLASTGDDGAAQLACDGNSYIKAISTPASDPNVTGVGGTDLIATPPTANADGSIATVGGTYQSESVWNETALLGGPAASGGGVSSIYRKPAYQFLVPSLRTSNMRWLPDVSYNAAVFNGVLVVYTCEAGDANCGSTVGQVFFRFGGTSAGSPQWAGLIALTDQLAHGRVGAINPELYILGASPSIASHFLHDVTTGDNSIPDLTPFLGAPFGTPITGYPATPGWDASSGLGSPKADALVPALVASALLH